MTTVIIAVVVLAVLGAIFGLVLAIASKVFAVEVDPREAPPAARRWPPRSARLWACPLAPQ